MAETLASLVVDLKLESAQLKKGVDEAGQKVEGLGKKLAGIASSINFGGMISGLRRVTSALFRFVDDGAKAADKTTEVGKRAEAFTKNADRMREALQGIGGGVAAHVGPAFEKLSSFFFDSADGAQALDTAVRVLSYVMRGIATAAIAVGAAFSVVGTALGGLAAAFVEVATGNFSGALEIIKDMRTMIGEEIGTAGKLIETAWEGAGDAVERTSKGMSKQLADLAAHLAEVKKQSAFDFEMKASGITRGLIQRQSDFADIGKSPREVLTSRSSGFDDFNAAAAAAADAMTARERLLQAATNHRAAKEFDLARRAEAAADAQGLLAEKATRAADALKDIKEIKTKEAEAEINSRREAMGWVSRASVDTAGSFSAATFAVAGFANAVLQAVPRLNNIVNAAQQGAQVGGVWGALIAVIVQLISETEGFSEILAVVNGDLDQLLGALSPLVSSIGSLMEALDPVTTVITALVRIALMPLVAIVQGLMLAVEWVIIGFMKLGEWINNLNAFRPQADKDAQAKQIADREAAAHQKARDAEQMLKGMWDDSVKDITGAFGTVTKSTEKAATQIDKLTAAFTNVPETFKLAYRRFQSADPDQVAAFGSIGDPRRAGPTIIVQGSVLTERKLAELMTTYQQQNSYARNGI